MLKNVDERFPPLACFHRPDRLDGPDEPIRCTVYDPPDSGCTIGSVAVHARRVVRGGAWTQWPDGQVQFFEGEAGADDRPFQLG